MKHSKKVKNYYENNTRKFFWFKRDHTKSIHQPLWKEESFTKEKALFYSNKLVLEEIMAHQKTTSLKILDLGCGVGSSLFYLQKHIPQKANYYGVTISATQIAIAIQQTKKLACSSTIQFIEADFTNLPEAIPKVDIAYSIEAFVHSPSAEKYLKEVSQRLNNGGKLILIDDFLNDAIDFSQLDRKDKQAITDFKYGWLANSLCTKSTLNKLASRYGLKIMDEIDLTLLMRNNTLMHQWIRLLVHSFRWLYELSPWKSYYFRSWIGGNAKQYCLKKGLVRYKKVMLVKI